MMHIAFECELQLGASDRIIHGIMLHFGDNWSFLLLRFCGSLFRRVHLGRFTHRHNASRKKDLMGLRRTLLHCGHSHVTRKSIFLLLQRRKWIVSKIPVSVSKVVPLGGHRHFDFPQFAIIVVVRGSIGKHVVLGSLLDSSLERFLYSVSVIKRFSARVLRDLIHGALIAHLILERFVGV